MSSSSPTGVPQVHPPFPFTGTTHKVEFGLGRSQLLPEDIKATQDMKNSANICQVCWRVLGR